MYEVKGFVFREKLKVKEETRKQHSCGEAVEKNKRKKHVVT